MGHAISGGRTALGVSASARRIRGGHGESSGMNGSMPAGLVPSSRQPVMHARPLRLLGIPSVAQEALARSCRYSSPEVTTVHLLTSLRRHGLEVLGRC